jgi:hypothetical protein
VNVSFSATHVFPEGDDKRMVSQWGNFFTREDPNKRAVKATVTASYNTSRDRIDVYIKGWCKRTKKDGTDSNHPASDVYDASAWMTKGEYFLLVDQIMAEVYATLKDGELAIAFAEALAKKAEKCTCGEES